jgi:hypothetical protein
MRQDLRECAIRNNALFTGRLLGAPCQHGSGGSGGSCLQAQLDSALGGGARQALRPANRKG